MSLRTALLIMIIGLTLDATAVEADDLPWAQSYRDRELILAPSVNQNPVLYACEEGRCVTMLCEGDLFPLLAPEKVRINDVKVKDGGKRLELHLRSEHLGKGKLLIEQVKSVEEPLQAYVVAWFVNLIAQDGDAELYVAHRDVDVLHFAGSNHAPGPGTGRVFKDPSAAEAAGLRLCPACFSPIHRIPDYQEEVQLGASVASHVRGMHMVVPDAERQDLVQTLGKKVLAQWPYELRGYNYRFTLLDSNQPNAVACPGGWVFVNNALLDLCETELELEAVIAHEIAHVEMRHGIRQLRTVRRNAMIGGIFAGLFAAGAAAGDSDAGPMIGAMAGVILSVAMEISVVGYSKDYVWEADAYAINYLARNYGKESRGEYGNLMRKLRYMVECVRQERYKVTEFSTHPDIESRVDFSNEARIEFFDPPPGFIYEKEGEIALELKVHGLTEHAYRRVSVVKRRSREVEYIDSGTELRMFISVESSNALGGPMELKHLHFRLGNEWYKIDNKEDTLIYPSHSVSVCLIRESGDPLEESSLLPEEIKLSNGESRYRSY